MAGPRAPESNHGAGESGGGGVIAWRRCPGCGGSGRRPDWRLERHLIVERIARCGDCVGLGSIGEIIRSQRSFPPVQ